MHDIIDHAVHLNKPHYHFFYVFFYLGGIITEYLLITT